MSEHDPLCRQQHWEGGDCFDCRLIARVRADEWERCEADERIAAWEAVAVHPTLRPAYDVEGPLLPAVIQLLSGLGRMRANLLAMIDGGSDGSE